MFLYVVPQDKHGHQAGKIFPLDHKAMVDAKLTDLSRERLKKAIGKLIDVGLLSVAANHQAGKRKRQYQLLLPSTSF